jgi:hypothetical protein
MEKTRFLTLIIVALVLLNIGTLGFIFLGGGPGMLPSLSGRPAVAQFIIHSLNFDDQQIKAYQQMWVAHRRNKQDLQMRLAQARESFLQGLSTGDTTQLAKVSNIQHDMELLTFQHFREVRGLCRPDQEPKFDAVIQEALRMLSRPDMPPPPPPRK